MKHTLMSSGPLFLLLLPGLASCGEPEIEVEGPVRQGVVWSGSTYTWELLSHRVSLVRTILQEDGAVQLGLIGGDWSTGESFADTPTYRSRHQAVSARGFVVVHGETELVVGPEGVATAAEILADAELLSMPEHVVVLRGYEIDTNIEQSGEYPEDYDPASGYTSRGFGFALSEPTVAEDGALSFTVEAELRWGVQDREDMNRAIPHAQTGVRVAWTAIGFVGSVEEEGLSGQVSYPYEPPFTEHPALEMGLGQGPGGVEVVGLRSFDLRMADQEGSEEGDYLRTFGVEIAEGSVQASLSNSSVLELLAIEMEAEATVARVGLRDPEAEVVEVVVEGEHAVGEDVLAGP